MKFKREYEIKEVTAYEVVTKTYNDKDELTNEIVETRETTKDRAEAYIQKRKKWYEKHGM